MTILYAAAIASLSWWQLLPPEPPKQLTPMQKQAFAYICTAQKIKQTCFSFGSEPLPLMLFQQQLVKLDPKYTRAYLDSVEQHAATPLSTEREVFPSIRNQRHCPLEVVFPTQALADFLVCEVYAAGDRNFTVSQVYLFAVKAKRVRFVSKVQVNYN